MRRALFLIFIAAVLIVGGFISFQASQSGVPSIPGLRVQTDNPEASPTQVTADKGAQFFIFALIVLGSLVGMGATIAIIFWFLNRQVEVARQKPNSAFSFSLSPSAPNSLGGALTRFPAITVSIVVVILIALSAAAAVALGVFNAK